jgi:hypothetical protein
MPSEGQRALEGDLVPIATRLLFEEHLFGEPNSCHGLHAEATAQGRTTQNWHSKGLSSESACPHSMQTGGEGSIDPRPAEKPTELIQTLPAHGGAQNAPPISSLNTVASRT